MAEYRPSGPSLPHPGADEPEPDTDDGKDVSGPVTRTGPDTIWIDPILTMSTSPIPHHSQSEQQQPRYGLWKAGPAPFLVKSFLYIDFAGSCDIPAPAKGE